MGDAVDMETTDLIKFRRELHQNPELSGEETETSQRVQRFIEKFKPDSTIKEIGGEGLAFFFDGNQEGKTILVRAELDALPIDEINDFEYKSRSQDKAHKCGHDGHMAILAGVARELSGSRPERGRVILLFQPAEETGEGASRMLHDVKFGNIKPDFVFALHNLPGFKEGSILVREEVFSSASVGIEIKLGGKTSHAAEPEKGINPAGATARIVQDLLNVSNRKDLFEDFVLATIVHIKLGEIAYGTSAGHAVIRATLRSYRNEDMEVLKSEAEKIAKKNAEQDHLNIGMRYVEYFPALINNPESVNIIRDAARANNFTVEELSHPFRWSEDFSHFTEKFRGAMFGLGAGLDTPKVHNPDYDFPDTLIKPGIKMFTTIINQITNS